MRLGRSEVKDTGVLRGGRGYPLDQRNLWFPGPLWGLTAESGAESRKIKILITPPDRILYTPRPIWIVYIR